MSVTNKKIIKHEDGFIIVKPNDDLCPFFCPVCQFPITSMEDVFSYNENQCCNDCSTYWVYLDKEKWKNGWRPSLEEVEKVTSVKKIKNLILDGLV